ncbi:MAG: T9SS type A sorting domain-containing protein [Chryseolinea sp.]
MKLSLQGVILILLVPTLLYSQSPGNVSGNLRWWLKSNVGTFRNAAKTQVALNGGNLFTWDDQSTVSNDAVNATAGTRPIYRTGFINGYPALEFDGTKFLDASVGPGVGRTQSFDMVLVFKLNTFQTTGGNDGVGTFIIDRASVTDSLMSFKIVNTNKYFYQRRQNDGSNLGGPVSSTPVNITSFVIIDYFRNWASAASSTEGIYLNGALEVSQAGPTGNMGAPLLRIGRHATDATAGTDGFFTEVALYNTNLSAPNRQRIHSYLGIKYGITLNSTINYVKSDGTVIYPSTGSHSGYVADIAGLGRDDNSGLLQSTSRSQNTNYVITATGASSLDNGDFFIWGSNNLSLASGSTDVDGTLIKTRLARVWKVAETNEVGTLTLSFDLSAVPGAKVGSDLRLLIDRDGDGFADNDQTPITGTLVGSIFSVTTAATTTLQNGDFFTIGSTNTSTTPLPVELADFKVTYEHPDVVASWRTTSEINNEYFILERAGEDLSFTDIAQRRGAGTTTLPRNYSVVDDSPFYGKSYYRLKQTDFDGRATYSSPRHIFIEGNDELSIYPNPVVEGTFKVKLNQPRFQLTELEIFDQQGKSLQQDVVTERDLNLYTFDLKKRLPSGLYIVRVRYNGRQAFLKLAIR